MWVNSYIGEQILGSILTHYRFPDQTFVGPPDAIDTLKQAVNQRNDWHKIAQ